MHRLDPGYDGISRGERRVHLMALAAFGILTVLAKAKFGTDLSRYRVEGIVGYLFYYAVLTGGVFLLCRGMRYSDRVCFRAAAVAGFAIFVGALR